MHKYSSNLLTGKLRSLCSDGVASAISLAIFINNDAFDTVPQQPAEAEIGLPPSLEEIKKAISQMSAGKTPGKDRILGEICKAAGPATLEAFNSVVTSIWEDEYMPQELRDASIVSS